MGKFQDLTGMRFGRLLVVKYIGVVNGLTTWVCKCDCGSVKESPGIYLKTTRTKSCGCLTTEKLIKRNTKHGKSRTLAFRSWLAMRQRCRKPSSEQAKRDYSDRGITICKRWEEFKNFLEDMGERPPNHTLERKDNSKGYFPENCCWATRSEQNNNTRANRLIEFGGESLTIAQWARKLQVPSSRIKDRLKLGWSVYDALSIPVLGRGIRYENIVAGDQ